MRYQLTALPLWTPWRHVVRADPCTALDCSNRGTTTDTDSSDGCDCTCDEGWAGPTCTYVQQRGYECGWYPTPQFPTDCPEDNAVDGVRRGKIALDDPSDLSPCYDYCDGDANCAGFFKGLDGLCFMWKSTQCGLTRISDGNSCYTKSTACVADTDCSNHGYTNDLDRSDGCLCHCREGWSGADCSEEWVLTVPENTYLPSEEGLVPCTAEGDCNGHGATTDANSSDGCECFCDEWRDGDELWYDGDSCERGRAPAETECSSPSDCNGHGETLDRDREDGCKCSCQQGWLGDNCESSDTPPDGETWPPLEDPLAALRQCGKECNCEGLVDSTADFDCHLQCARDHLPSWFSSIIHCQAMCSEANDRTDVCFQACSSALLAPEDIAPWTAMLDDRNRCLVACDHSSEREALRACVASCFTPDMVADRDRHLQRAHELWVQQKCGRQCTGDGDAASSDAACQNECFATHAAVQPWSSECG